MSAAPVACEASAPVPRYGTRPSGSRLAGLNGATALAAANASMNPASATEVGWTAAKLLFLRTSLTAVPEACQ